MTMMLKKNKYAKKILTSGVSLVEIVIGAAIITTTFVAIIGINVSITRMAHNNPTKIQAAMLAEEGIEAVRILRDNSWTSNIASKTVGTPYYLYWNGATWSSTSSVQVVDGIFYRTLILGNAYRDGSNNLVSSGTVDDNTRLVTVNISWNESEATSTRQLQSYIFNTFNN